MIVPSLARGRGAPAQRAKPGAGRGHGLAHPRAARLQLPAHRPRRRRSGSRSSSARTSCSPARPGGRAVRGAPGALGARPAGEGDPDGLVLPCADRGAERRSWFVYPVLLPSGADRDAVIAELGGRGHRGQGLPAVHPPAAALPRAVRLPRGPVPGRRGRRPRASSRSRSSPRWARRRWSGSSRRWRRRSALGLTVAAAEPAAQTRSGRRSSSGPCCRIPSSHGVNSTPSSDRALELSARACHSRKVSWPRAEQRRAADQPRDAPRPSTARPRASGTGIVGGTQPRPGLVDRHRAAARAWSRSRRRGCSARRACPRSNAASCPAATSSA